MPDDDAKQVLHLVQDCDALIVGSPCYWGNMTGQLKMLFDRWVYGMMDHSESGYPIPLLKGKKAVSEIEQFEELKKDLVFLLSEDEDPQN